MAQVFGEKSEYLIKKDRYFRYLAAILLVLYFFILFYLWSVFKNSNYLLISFLALVLLYLLKRLIEQKLDISDKFYSGRNGEYEICDELEKFPDEYSIFQDVKLDSMNGNIDFVVIGPTGIFVIEVKSQRGKVEFKREYEQKFLRQTMNEAMNLHNHLRQNIGKDYFVNPVLVFSRASVRFGLTPVNKVYVIGKAFLKELILTGKKRLSQEEITNLKNQLLRAVKVNAKIT
jgi:hypothetical protein